MASLCAWLTARAVREHDSPAERTRKAVFVPASWAVLLFTVTTASAALWSPGAPSTAAAHSFLLAASIAVHILLHRGAPVVRLVEVLILTCATVSVYFDWVSASGLYPRVWVVVVVCLDVSLVFNVNAAVPVATVCVTVLWLMVEGTEAFVRFGLYEAAPVERSAGTIKVCDCANPPCKLAFDPSNMFLGIFVFLFDFWITRGFAEQMRDQMQVISEAMHTCDVFCEHLSLYEIEEADAVLTGEVAERLPEGLSNTFRRLLENLESYKMYLPDSVLLHRDEASQSSLPEASAPGIGAERADICICFTDIESSTALWEQQHQAMYAALQLHNTILRSVFCTHGGYEVKTIGDAFMLAFTKVQDGVAFALESQKALVQADWPNDLLGVPLCARVESENGVLWNGLRVRMGINCGTVRVDRNPVTHRCDYFGQAVNVAARIESELKHGGLTGISADTLKKLGDGGLEELQHPAVFTLGSRKLKGVSQPVDISVLLPQGMSERWRVTTDTPVQVDRDELAVTSPVFESPLGDQRRRSPMPSLGRTESPRTGSYSRRSPTFRAASELLVLSSVNSRPSNCRSSGGGLGLRSTSVGSAGSVVVGSPVLPGLHTAHSKLMLRTSSGLERTTATCAHVGTTLVDASALDHLVPSFVSSVEYAADVAQGTVQAVVSSSCVVTWNAPRPCSGHTVHAAHFTALLCSRTARQGVPSWTGVATGKVLHGSVAGCRRRFATVVGGCVELARALSAAAELNTLRTLVVGPAVVHFDQANRLEDLVSASGAFQVFSVVHPLTTTTADFEDEPAPAVIPEQRSPDPFKSQANIPKALPRLWGVEASWAGDR
eukprot:TRINITY_DN6885_c0_g1_i1.p1 TRINITY_DN6885_c0_g1~~TRINITY_DN6885_c0_g1_i1.p1  ORF type:complete len:835 (+),score=123.54 TRINITY_DN6885_c0_g1_i1:68-2572(+)